MSEARKCDRCGMLYDQVCEPKIDAITNSRVIDILKDDEYVPYITGLRVHAYLKGSSEVVDLCPKCREDFVKFLCEE